MLAFFICDDVYMQEIGNNSTLPFLCPTCNEEDDKRLVDFFDLLLQWDIENERREKQEN